mmetsp:Transcript_22602/g.70720  ORF Transcript_22602/g.70720 Transcript_22602/m.70720 type:complete len:138 (+) Transcript_22602:3494-3907(+)
MARRFLHELESFSLSPEMRLGAQILKARVIMATSKSDIDRAMQILLEVIQTDQNCVPAIFGISMGFLMEGSIAKARNALKRIAKLPHSHGWIRELERSYLFLAGSSCFMVASGQLQPQIFTFEGVNLTSPKTYVNVV